MIDTEKFKRAAIIAKQKGASMPTTAEMLIRLGCLRDKALDITIDAWSAP